MGTYSFTGNIDTLSSRPQLVPSLDDRRLEPIPRQPPRSCGASYASTRDENRFSGSEEGHGVGESKWKKGIVDRFKGLYSYSVRG